MIWIIWSVILVEVSLNFNHVGAVLGGPNDNEVHLPSQILPLLVGLFGFVRTIFLAFKDWRAVDGDMEPSEAGPTEYHRSRTMKFGLDMFQAFSPGMAKDIEHKEHKPDEVDDLESKRSRKVRYLVAVLPWLSLLEYFQDKPQVWKRLSMPPPQSNEKSSSALKPERETTQRKPSPERQESDDSAA